MTSDDGGDGGEPRDGERSDSATSFADLLERIGAASHSEEMIDEDDDPPSSLSDLSEEISESSSSTGFQWVDDASETNAANKGSAALRGRGDLAGGEFEEPHSDPKLEALIELIGNSPNVLLQGPLLCPAEYDTCTTLMRSTPSKRINLLLITIGQSPAERLNVCRGYLDSLPETVTVVSVGDTSRSGTSTTTTEQVEETTVTVKSIPDPADLMRLGTVVSKLLSEWDSEDASTVVCFHSLTELLRFVEGWESVFRFLHIFCGRINSIGAKAHYHIDPNAHDEQMIARFRPLFDAVAVFKEDGSLSVEQ